MPLNPPPTVQGNVCLVSQKMIRSDMSRAAMLTFALHTADSTLATYQDAIDDFQANFNTQFTANMIDNEVSVLPPTAICGQGTTDVLVVTAAGAAVVGANAGSDMPPNVSVLFKKSTSSGGKQNRGRTYFPFCLPSVNVAENGTIGSTWLGLMAGWSAAFLAQLVTDSTPMGITNKHYNQPLPPHYVTAVTISAAQVTAFVPETIIATQRRRLGRS